LEADAVEAVADGADVDDPHALRVDAVDALPALREKMPAAEVADRAV
jgi:hypothetical protein